MKLNHTVNYLSICLCMIGLFHYSCSNRIDKIDFYTYELTGDADFRVDFFALDMEMGSKSSIIDKLHKYNPDIFVPSSLKESVWDFNNQKFYIESSSTGIIYHCKLKKGTTIRIKPKEN